MRSGTELSQFRRVFLPSITDNFGIELLTSTVLLVVVPRKQYIEKENHSNSDQTTVDRWMNDLQFYVLFNSISVISGRCLDDNERLCAMELRLRLRRFYLE